MGCPRQAGWGGHSRARLGASSSTPSTWLQEEHSTGGRLGLSEASGDLSILLCQQGRMRESCAPIATGSTSSSGPGGEELLQPGGDHLGSFL